MERFVKGDVVVIPFPFSDLSSSKKRPALVVSELKGQDVILCAITSKNTKSNYSIPLSDREFDSGSLKKESNILPNKLLTAEKSVIHYKVGSLTATKTKEIVEKICEIVRC